METIRSEWRAKLMDPTARSAADFRQKINRALQKVKDDYRTAYFNLHKKARLGVNEDSKKKELLKDARLACLDKLAKGVSLLSHSTLTDLQTRLAKVQTCFTLVKDELDASPICPHCNFRPQEENLGASGTAVLDQIDKQIDGLLENWTKTLLDNLNDPTAKKSIKLLPEAQKEAVNLIFEDSVELRVQEVLEEKLATILDEFGVDKTQDVLDSAESGAVFEKLYAHPRASAKPPSLTDHRPGIAVTCGPANRYSQRNCALG
jgi:hypothetical protein